MTGFGGRAFEFLGQPGSVYSLVSEKFHKVSSPTLHAQRNSFTSVLCRAHVSEETSYEHWHGYCLG